MGVANTETTTVCVCDDATYYSAPPPINTACATRLFLFWLVESVAMADK